MLRFTLNGKRREMGLGSFPDIDLANVRIRASEYRNLAKEGIDPIEARKIEAEKVPNFTVCAAQFIRARRRGWKNAKHARQWVSTLKTYVVSTLKTYARPIIGSKQVDVIDTKHILEILTPIWRTKTETAIGSTIRDELCYFLYLTLKTKHHPFRYNNYHLIYRRWF